MSKKNSRNYRSGKGGKGSNRGNRNYNRTKNTTTKEEIPSKAMDLDRNDYYTKESRFKPNPEKAQNDPAWYMFDETIARDAGNLNFFNRVSVPLQVVNIPEHDGTETGYGTRIPSLMSFRFVPTPGPCVDMTSPVNQQALAMWKLVQRRVQKELPFTPGDLMQYILAMDSIYMLYFWLQRLYGINNYYNAINPSMPRMYFRANGFEPDSLANNLGWEDFRKDLNVLGNLVNELRVPNGVKLIERHTWLVTNIFKDSESEKAQAYMFTPSCYYEYNNTGGQGGASLILKHLPASGATLQTQISQFKKLLNTILLDKDISLMQSWLMRAFDEKEFYKVGLLSDSTVIAPVFVPEVLPQIHNMRLVGEQRSVGANTGDITQTPTDGINQALLFERGAFGHMSKDALMWLDVIKDHPDIADNFVATRFVPIVESKEVSGSHYIHPISFGTELVETAAIYNVSSGPEYTLHSNAIGCTTKSIGQPGFGMVWRSIDEICCWAHFNMGPMLFATTDDHFEVYTYTGNLEISNPETINVLSDITNSALFSDRELTRINYAAVMGEVMTNLPYTKI